MPIIEEEYYYSGERAICWIYYCYLIFIFFLIEIVELG
jgi:hypothetical protein